MEKMLKVEQLVRCKLNYWDEPMKLVRIAKRERIGHKSYGFYRYFVTAPDAPVGHGTWCDISKLVVLTPLEELALAAED